MSKKKQAVLNVEIVRFVDESQPGFVECKLVDALGELHFFIEKTAIVSREDLWWDSVYPRPGSIACEIVEQWVDEIQRPLTRIDTTRPWDVESTREVTEFVVLSSQVTPSRSA